MEAKNVSMDPCGGVPDSLCVSVMFGYGRFFHEVDKWMVTEKVYLNCYKGYWRGGVLVL